MTVGGWWRRLHPVVWWVLLLIVVLVVGVVLVDRSEVLVDVQQVEQPAGWLIV